MRPRAIRLAALAALLVLFATPSHAANAMHPTFAVLDDAGVPASRSGRFASSERTCGACHDAAYIAAHSGHWNERVKAECAACHWEGGSLPTTSAVLGSDGKLRRDALRISAPQDAHCAACHGVVHADASPVRLPEDFEAPRRAESDYGFTLRTGAVFSADDVAESFLNLRDKESLHAPWDVHARRLVKCVDCHFASNNPTRKDLKKTPLDFLVQDPRRIPLSEFLHRPDHRLAAATCRSCHDPMKVHEFLPYKKRHLDALECQSCHIPHPMGPALRMLDATVVREDGAPLASYRGLERVPGVPLDATFAEGYAPLLLPKRDAGGETRLAPFNVIEAWEWVSGATGRAVPLDTLRLALLENGRHAPAVIAAFDRDGDGRLSDLELRLDSAAKRELVAGRLAALGVAEPRVAHRLERHALEHGVLAGAQVQHDCNGCHVRGSRLDGRLALSPYTPYGAAADSADSAGVSGATGVRVVVAADGSREAFASAQATGLYVFGNARRSWTNRAGFLLFLAVVLGTSSHGVARVFAAKRTHAAEPPRERVYLYRTYERVWHWLMATSILALMLTGMQVTFASSHALIPLPIAVRVHNFFAIVLTVNAFLSLFYHLAAGAIRQFIPKREGLGQQIVEQARYYASGMLLGQPQPSPKSRERKLNPLQQLTYLALLNVLFPFQVVTGALIWGASRWPQMAASLGGLTLVAPLHALGSWLFLSFFVLHLYLTTTGHTVFSHVRAMIDGYEELELDSASPSNAGGTRASSRS